MSQNMSKDKAFSMLFKCSSLRSNFYLVASYKIKWIYLGCDLIVGSYIIKWRLHNMMHKPLVRNHILVVNGTIMVHFKISMFIFIYLPMALKESIRLILSYSNTCVLKLDHGFYKHHKLDVMLLFELIYLLSHTSKQLYVPKSSLWNLTLTHPYHVDIKYIWWKNHGWM